MILNFIKTYYLQISIILGIVFVWVWSVYNSLVKKRNQVKTDFSDVNIQLGKKIALVDKLTQMVGDYAKHEKGTYKEVAEARSAVQSSKTASDSTKAQNMLTDSLRSLMMVVESNPKLSASQTYRDLRDDLKQIENAIAESREAYNLSVQEYNNAVQTFPNLLISNILGFKNENLFEQS